MFQELRKGSEPNEISMFYHCSACIRELPPGQSPRQWARLEVGVTDKGIQVYCVRHELNVVHIDFTKEAA